jgi:hypothetical protein
MSTPSKEAQGNRPSASAIAAANKIIDYEAAAPGWMNCEKVSKIIQSAIEETKQTMLNEGGTGFRVAQPQRSEPQEWTSKKVESYGIDYGWSEKLAKDINAALAAEREKREADKLRAQMLEAQRNDLRSQLAAAVEALKEIRDQIPHFDHAFLIINGREIWIHDFIQVVLAKCQQMPHTECEHEFDVCTGPPDDARLGKRICNFCGELEKEVSETPFYNAHLSNEGELSDPAKQ